MISYGSVIKTNVPPKRIKMISVRMGVLDENCAFMGRRVGKEI